MPALPFLLPLSSGFASLKNEILLRAVVLTRVLLACAVLAGISPSPVWAQAVAPNLNPSSNLFLDAPAYGSGGPHAYGIVLADLNGDGKQDVIVANACTGCTSASVGVLLGNGDSTFQPAAAYASGGAGVLLVAVGDVNGDGKRDVVVENQCVSQSNCTKGSIGVLLGNGDGTLQSAFTYTLPSEGGYILSLADLNGDNKVDLVVTACAANNCNPGTVGVMRGNGDGTFQAPVLYSSGGLFPVTVAVSDMWGRETGSGCEQPLRRDVWGAAKHVCGATRKW